MADTGIGMTSAEAGRLCNDFVHIKNEKTRDILGGGPGLSLARKLTLVCGGDVGVTSQPDTGSTFTVVLQSDFRPPATDDATPRDSHLAA